MSEHPHSLTTHDIIESMDHQIQEQAERIEELEAAIGELEAQVLGLRPTPIEFQQAKRIAELESALQNIIAHQDAIGGDLAKMSAVRRMAVRALGGDGE